MTRHIWCCSPAVTLHFLPTSCGNEVFVFTEPIESVCSASGSIIGGAMLFSHDRWPTLKPGQIAVAEPVCSKRQEEGEKGRDTREWLRGCAAAGANETM